MKALRLVMGYRNSTPLNVILAEARKPPLFIQFKFLKLNFLSRVSTLSQHPLWPLLTSLDQILKNPSRRNKKVEIPLVNTFNILIPYKNILPLETKPLCFSYNYQAFFFAPNIDTVSGEKLKHPKDIMKDFSSIFNYEINNTRCIFTDGSVSPEATTSGFALLTSDGEYVYQKYQFPLKVSSFCAESLAILEAIRVIIKENWFKSSFLIHYQPFSLCREIFICRKVHI